MKIWITTKVPVYVTIWWHIYNVTIGDSTLKQTFHWILNSGKFRQNDISFPWTYSLQRIYGKWFKQKLFSQCHTSFVTH